MAEKIDKNMKYILLLLFPFMIPLVFGVCLEAFEKTSNRREEWYGRREAAEGIGAKLVSLKGHSE